MIDQQWALVAFENGVIRSGKVSEQYMLGKKVFRLEQIVHEQPSRCEYFSCDSVQGIRISSQEEIQFLKSESLIT